MKKILLISVLLLAGCQSSRTYQVLGLTKTGEVVINAGKADIKPETNFDIFDKKNPNIPVARMMITRTTNARSSGVLVNSRLDGSEFEPVNIYTGMLCRQTSKETLKAEKKAYKYQKKALKRQYKLMKIKAKQDVYKSLGENSKDKDVKSIKAGMIKVEK